MEGLLHPVGPEEVRTYWIRRGAAVTALLVLVISLGLVLSNLGGADDNATPAETTAVPAPAAAKEPATTQSPPPAQAPPGAGVPNAVSDEEAVPVPSSARAATTLEPEPANTFHLAGGQGNDEAG